MEPETPADPTSALTPIPGLAVGRIVHYVLPAHSPHAGEIRPAIIVRVFDAVVGRVNLQVFLDGDNDGVVAAGETWWRTSIYHDPAPPVEPNTWHFPPRV